MMLFYDGWRSSSAVSQRRIDFFNHLLPQVSGDAAGYFFSSVTTASQSSSEGGVLRYCSQRVR